MSSGTRRAHGYPNPALLLPVLLFVILVPSCQVPDYLYYNLADINDYRNFPSITISRSPRPSVLNYSGHQSDPLIAGLHGNETNPSSLTDFLSSTGTVSFIITRNDSVLFEHYFGRFNETSVIPSFSVAKSVVSALVGISLGNGTIRSLDQPITDFLPDLRDPGFRQVTLRHLLEMRSGIRYNERYVDPFGNVARFYYGDNLEKYVLNLRIDRPPDQLYTYQSANTQLLGIALERAYGKRLSTLLEEQIWHPMGMEYDATWSVDGEEHAQIKAFCCLNVRTRDLARFGLLYLHRGIRVNDTIVPPAWIDETMKITNNSHDSQGYPYTYHWRVTEEGEMFAKGVLGQFIFISPAKKLVIVRCGKAVGNVEWVRLFQKIAAGL